MGPERRILIFDLDGTLVDSNGYNQRRFCEMLATEHAIAPEVSADHYVRTVGQGPRAQFSTLLATRGIEDEATIAGLTERYWYAIEDVDPPVFPDVVPALNALHTAGHILAVSSGSIQTSVDRKLRVTGLATYFPNALGSIEGDSARSKGAGHFRLIAGAMGITPAELQARALYIGDGLYDMQVARKAGILALGRLTGDNAAALRDAGADHVIASLAELGGLLTGLEIENRIAESGV